MKPSSAEWSCMAKQMLVTHTEPGSSYVRRTEEHNESVDKHNAVVWPEDIPRFRPMQCIIDTILRDNVETEVLRLVGVEYLSLCIWSNR